MFSNFTKCRTTKYFSDYIDSCVKSVQLSPEQLEGVDRGLMTNAPGRCHLVSHVDETPGPRAVACRLHDSQSSICRVLSLA
ncbi:hypothetical protein TNCV_3824581 [Trichonephila clavipes]|nr:hypothetical protein TNCV_3824581 [Trichonephila clavipes]